MTWFVVDGMDGTGKSTIAKEIKKLLETRHRKVLLIEHPDKNKLIGRLESRFLQSNSGKIAKIMTTLTFITDVIGSLIEKWLRNEEYDDFVFVRYIMSVAYLPDKFAPKAYRIIADILPMPDNRILVDADVDIALGRIDNRGDELELFENRDDLIRTRKTMIELSEDGWIVIDNSGPRDQIDRILKQLVESCI